MKRPTGGVGRQQPTNLNEHIIAVRDPLPNSTAGDTSTSRFIATLPDGQTRTTIETTDSIGKLLDALLLAFGAMPTLSPEACAACSKPLPQGTREWMSITSRPHLAVAYFLCEDCRGHDSARMSVRVKRRLATGAAKLGMIESRADTAEGTP